MLQLTLIRHAKSSWKDASLPDFERPLNRRGLDNAPLMGRVIRDMGPGFDRILSSPARRALSTAQLIAAEIDYPTDTIEEIDDLYGAGVATLLRCVQSLDAGCRRAALVAHNPGLTDFCNYLSGEYIANLPTCAVAVIEFALDDWRAVERDAGRLAHYDYPRRHMD